MTTLTTTENKTNDIRHTINATFKGNPLIIKIRLNDECKNGHQDFSITGTTYRPFEKGDRKDGDWKVFNGKNYTFDSGGCIHETIIKARPNLQIFVNLHLCDYEGIPTYAVENGFYHLTNGFNNTKPESADFKSEFCSYYRITAKQFDSLKTAKNKLQYALQLKELGILQQWKEEANKAIQMLEEMTGKIFVVDSVKTQYHAPTTEEIKEEETKQNNGYYTPEAEEQREAAKMDGILSKLEAERDKDIAKATEEFEVNKQVLLIGGEKALNNCIFYNHSRTLSFNWRGYDRISEELYNKIAADISLPEGVKIENKKD